MIIGRAPFRISFAGGGSDIESFYRKSAGAVVSTTIDKYMYLMIHPYFHNKIRIKYSRTEDVRSTDDIQHPLVRECLRLLEINRGVEIASIADIPAGTGLGSSSSFTVSLLNALSAYRQRMRSKEWLAEKACTIEIEKVGEPIGKQDQYAASFGGMNYFRFQRDGTVLAEPIILPAETKKRLEESLLMFYVGNERSASDILSRQKEEMDKEDKFKRVCQMVELAEELKRALSRGDLGDFGSLLHQGWLLKRGVTGGISNNHLDGLYEKALEAGARGGKVLGAGAGGFFLFYCEPENQEDLRTALGLRELRFRFDDEGARILYFSDVVSNGVVDNPCEKGDTTE